MKMDNLLKQYSTGSINVKNVWRNGIGPKEFGQWYLNSNLRKNRQIKRKRGLIK